MCLNAGDAAKLPSASHSRRAIPSLFWNWESKSGVMYSNYPAEATQEMGEVGSTKQATYGAAPSVGDGRMQIPHNTHILSSLRPGFIGHTMRRESTKE